MKPSHTERRRWLPGSPPAWIPEHENEFGRLMLQKALDLMKKGDEVRDLDIFEYCNTGGRRQRASYFLDRSLMVLRSAHMIRPPSDTGVAHEYSADGSVLRLGLNKPPNEHLYDHDDLRVDSEHRLCQACKDVFNYFCHWLKISLERTDSETRHPLPNIVVHHFNILSLMAWSSTGGCYLCRIVRSYLEARSPAVVDPLSNAEKYRIEVCWPKSRSLAYKGELYFVLVDPSKPRGNWNFVRFYRMAIWPNQIFGHCFDFPAQVSKYIYSITADGGWEEDWKDYTSGPVSQALAQSWLHDCLANVDGKHTICNAKPSSFMPTRLLDIQSTEERGYIRIINPAREPDAFVDCSDWATLSHCWGSWGEQNNPVTKICNVAERETTGIHVSQLPLTFRDAIEVCRWLSIRWLWIDCLCIIQDSEEDWLKEASLLHKIFRHGIINISANFGVNSSKGLFSARDPQDVSAIQFSSKTLNQSWRLTPDSYHAFTWMDQMPSLSRVWIHRERQLARRILHFNHNEVIWECCGTEGSAFASEMFPNGSPLKHLFRNGTKYQIGTLQAASKSNHEEIYSIWDDVCESFSSKALTKSSDMPIVLSSLAKEFAELLPGDEYLAGLWRSKLPHNLAWTAEEKRREDMDESVAPSWSWLSTGRSVELQGDSIQESAASLLEILSLSLKPHHNGIFGHLEYGHLHVRGFLRQLHISFTEGKGIELGFLDGDEYQHLGPEWDAYRGHLGEVKLDQSVATEKLDCYCLPVMLSKWPQTDFRVIVTCLLLQKEVSDTGKRFRRIGVVELSGVYALRFRYMNASGHSSLGESVWETLVNTIQCDDKKEREEQGRNVKGFQGHGYDREDIDGNSLRKRQENPNNESIDSGNHDTSNAIRVKEDEDLKEETPSQVPRDTNDKRDPAPVDILTSLYQYDDLLPDLEALVRLKPQTLTLI